MSDRRYSQNDLNALSFTGVDWGAKPALVFSDAEDRSVRIPMTPAMATQIVRSVIPILLPIDGDAVAATGAPAPTSIKSKPKAYVQLGRCDGALFTASTPPGGTTLYFRDGRKLDRADLPDAVMATAKRLIP